MIIAVNMCDEVPDTNVVVIAFSDSDGQPAGRIVVVWAHAINVGNTELDKQAILAYKDILESVQAEMYKSTYGNGVKQLLEDVREIFDLPGLSMTAYVPLSAVCCRCFGGFAAVC